VAGGQDPSGVPVTDVERERAEARAEGERMLVEGKLFAKIVTGLLDGVVIVVLAGIFVIACIAAFKGVVWIWNQ
jgi:hypothetical protein